MAKLFNYIKVAYGMYFKRRLIFFYYINNRIFENVELDSGVNFSIIKNVDEYLDSCNKFKIPPSRHYLNRFANNATFYFTHNNSDYLSYGWAITNCDSFCLEYIHLSMKIGNSAFILFDFNTNENYRKLGHYTKLLSRIIQENSDYALLGYTAPSNPGGIKGIVNSGFTTLGTYRRSEHSKFFAALNENGVQISKSRKKYLTK